MIESSEKFQFLIDIGSELVDVKRAMAFLAMITENVY